MRFCTSCGSALEFFEFLDGELCSSCIDGSTREKKPAKPAAETENQLNGLGETTLCLEGDRLLLKSSEGWILWSAPINEQHKLQDVLGRAQRILDIRKKRSSRKTELK